MNYIKASISLLAMMLLASCSMIDTTNNNSEDEINIVVKHTDDIISKEDSSGASEKDNIFPDVKIADNLASNLDSMQVSIDGELVTLGTCVKQYMSILPPSEYGVDTGIAKTDAMAYSCQTKGLDVYYNIGSGVITGIEDDTEHNKIKYEDTLLSSIETDCEYCTTNNFYSIVLPGNITWGSSLSDIKDAYGDEGIWVDRESDDTTEHILGYEYKLDNGYTYLTYFKIDNYKGLYKISLDMHK